MNLKILVFTSLLLLNVLAASPVQGSNQTSTEPAADTASLYEALDKLIRGVSLIGDALTAILRYIFASIGVEVPDAAIKIGTIMLIILTLWKLGNAVSKIVLYAMIFLLISLFAGLAPSIAQLF